jgi:hypothetical protein
VVLPDKTLLQARFSPLEPVTAVYAWAASLLAPGVPPFFFYTVPPMTPVLPPAPGRAAPSLGDLGWVPAAKVLLGWGAPGERAPPPPPGRAVATAPSGAPVARYVVPPPVPFPPVGEIAEDGQYRQRAAPAPSGASAPPDKDARARALLEKMMGKKK